ncbi:MAG: LCP family protein [Clostridiales bacterium]|nr:LCP family protein [Clostridiales bacterium]
MRRRYRRRRNTTPGIAISGVVLAASVLFEILLYNTKLLPTAYLAAAAVVLLIFVALTELLVWNMYNRIRFVVGSIFAVLVVGVLAMASVYIYRTTDTVSDISGVNTEVAAVGIYVLTDDTAETVEDAQGYTFGILAELDRDNTDQTVSELETELGTSVTTAEYRGLTELVDGLLGGEAGAMILNQAYLDVIEEIDGYTDISSKIREIVVKEVETQIETTEDTSGDGSSSGKVYTVYISGIDSRTGLVSNSRSDVNIVATINTETRQVLLVSTPRDYYVPLSISNGEPDKLTHAGIYGISVCMDTLGMLYDVDINYYFRLNFSGFEEIIDALGGITVYSDYEFTTENTTGFHFNQGENYMNGEEALAFVRERYAFTEGDRQRGKNQMAVIEAVIDRLLSPDILKNYSSLLSSISGNFETNVTYEEIARLFQQQLTNGGSWNVVTYSVNGTGDTQKPYSLSTTAYVMVPDYTTVDFAIEMMAEVRNGQTITQEMADSGASSAGTAEDLATDNAVTDETAAAETTTDGTAAAETTTDETGTVTTTEEITTEAVPVDGTTG